MLALLPLIIGSAIAASGWWMLADDIPLARAIATAIPYIILIGSVPAAFIYATLRFRWPFMLAAALLAATFPAIVAYRYFLPERDIFAAGLIMTTALVHALSFKVLQELFRRRTPRR